jgi:deoxyribonuclease-4
MSAAGGLENVFREGLRVGCECLQLFVKNQRQWNAKPLAPEQIDRFRAAAMESGLRPVVAHAGYLLNLASPDETGRRKSVAALLDEYDRCEALGVPFLIVHPGAALQGTVGDALVQVARSLNEIHELRPLADTRVLLETTAGQGSTIGYRFEHFREIFSATACPDRTGICLDTCHLFAGGYDFRTPEGYARMIESMDNLIGLNRVKCIHLNDSKRELGSRVDRHEHIAKGRIGKEGFANVVNDPRLANLPMILETPKGVDGRGTDFDRVNLKRLRSLCATPRRSVLCPES